jgi:hypothetical protein
LTRIGPHAISSPPFRRPPKSGTAGRRLQSPASFRRHVMPPRVAAGSALIPLHFPSSGPWSSPLHGWMVAAGRHTPSYAHGVARRSYSASRVTSWRGESRPGHSHSRASVASLRPRAQERPAGRSHRFSHFHPTGFPTPHHSHHAHARSHLAWAAARGSSGAGVRSRVYSSGLASWPGGARPYRARCSRIPPRSVPEFFCLRSVH